MRRVGGRDEEHLRSFRSLSHRSIGETMSDEQPFDHNHQPRLNSTGSNGIYDETQMLLPQQQPQHPLSSCMLDSLSFLQPPSQSPPPSFSKQKDESMLKTTFVTSSLPTTVASFPVASAATSPTSPSKLIGDTLQKAFNAVLSASISDSSNHAHGSGSNPRQGRRRSSSGSSAGGADLLLLSSGARRSNNNNSSKRHHHHPLAATRWHLSVPASPRGARKLRRRRRMICIAVVALLLLITTILSMIVVVTLNNSAAFRNQRDGGGNLHDFKKIWFNNGSNGSNDKGKNNSANGTSSASARNPIMAVPRALRPRVDKIQGVPHYYLFPTDLVKEEKKSRDDNHHHSSSSHHEHNSSTPVPTPAPTDPSHHPPPIPAPITLPVSPPKHSRSLWSLWSWGFHSSNVNNVTNGDNGGSTKPSHDSTGAAASPTSPALTSTPTQAPTPVPLPDPTASGVLILFHACKQSGADWFLLPEHRVLVWNALTKHNLAVLAVTSQDRSASQCWTGADVAATKSNSSNKKHGSTNGTAVDDIDDATPDARDADDNDDDALSNIDAAHRSKHRVPVSSVVQAWIRDHSAEFVVDEDSVARYGLGVSSSASFLFHVYQPLNLTRMALYVTPHGYRLPPLPPSTPVPGAGGQFAYSHDSDDEADKARLRKLAIPTVWIGMSRDATIYAAMRRHHQRLKAAGAKSLFLDVTPSSSSSSPFSFSRCACVPELTLEACSMLKSKLFMTNDGGADVNPSGTTTVIGADKDDPTKKKTVTAGGHDNGNAIISEALSRYKDWLANLESDLTNALALEQYSDKRDKGQTENRKANMMPTGYRYRPGLWDGRTSPLLYQSNDHWLRSAIENELRACRAYHAMTAANSTQVLTFFAEPQGRDDKKGTIVSNADATTDSDQNKNPTEDGGGDVVIDSDTTANPGTDADVATSNFQDSDRGIDDDTVNGALSYDDDIVAKKGKDKKQHTKKETIQNKDKGGKI